MSQAAMKVLEGILQDLASKINASGIVAEKEALKEAHAAIERIILDQVTRSQ